MKTLRHRVLFLLAFLLIALVGLLYFQTRPAPVLTVMTWPGAYGRAQASAQMRPYGAERGVDVRTALWDGDIKDIRAMVEKRQFKADVIDMELPVAVQACSRDLLEKIDPAMLPPGVDNSPARQDLVPGAIGPCWIGGMVYAQVMVFSPKLKRAPTSLADFFNTKAFPGKRALSRAAPKFNLEMALLADGVAPGDVYKTLASKDGTDRAFQKLDQLRPYIVWWQTEADAARILASGDVLMTSAQSGVIATAARLENRAFGIQWNASLTELFSWAIAKASPNLRNAQQFLYFTGMPAIQTRLLRTAGQVGLAKGLNESLPPELQPISPTAAANSAGALRVDAAFWHENEARLRQRFETWLSPAPKP